MGNAVAFVGFQKKSRFRWRLRPNGYIATGTGSWYKDASRGPILDKADQPARGADDSFAAVAEYAPALLWRGDAHGKCTYLNRAQREFWGVSLDDVGRFTWASTLLEEDNARVFEPFAAAMSSQQPFQCEGRYRRADGAIRVLQTRAEPCFTDAGIFSGMIGVNLDVTDERQMQADLQRADQRRVLMLEEMRHRIKNLMATVTAIAAQTGRTATSIEEFSASFRARLAAMGHTHDLLMKDASDSVRLRDILQSELAPYLDDASFSRALALEGEDVRLSGRGAVSFALIVHELATNAAKYGAYAGSGAIAVDWTQANEMVRLRWVETGVSIESPTRQGFGTKLIDTLTRGDLAGEFSFDFAHTGLIASLRFPLVSTDSSAI